MKRMEWNGFKVASLLLIIFFGVLSLVFGIILISEYLIVYESDARLEVEEAYFEESGKTGEDTELDVFVLVTNMGDRECDSHIRAFIIDKDTNIAMDDTYTETVNIHGDSTHEAHFEMTVPSDARYRVELLVYKDEMISVKGEGHVDLEAGGRGGQDYRTQEQDDAEEKASLATPFIGAPLLILALMAVLLLFRRWRR